MPTQLLPIGPAVVLVQNVVYALPVKPSTITTSAPCDTSIDGTTWTAFTSGSVNSGGKFIRCTTASPTVVCATPSAGGGSSLPTAPVGQVLISQGAGVAPIFSINVACAQVNLGAHLIFDSPTGMLVIPGIIRLGESLVSAWPSGIQAGSLANFSDSTVNTVGSTVAGGGSNHVLARWNGTVWKVVA